MPNILALLASACANRLGLYDFQSYNPFQLVRYVYSRRQPTFLAGHILQVVAVPAGNHAIELRNKP